MAADQLRYEVEVTFIDDIEYNSNHVFMATQIKTKYGKEILNLIMEANKTEESKELEEELTRRVNSINVSSN